MHIVWSLTQVEKDMARAEAMRRQAQNEQRRLAGRNNGPAVGPSAIRAHLIGTAGEVAVASYLGLKHCLFIEKQARRHSYDLPPNIDVKTRSNHSYDLICLKDESPNKILVLVTVQYKQIRLHGWMKSSMAPSIGTWMERVRNRGCYYIPQHQLLSMQSLKQCLNAPTLQNTP